MSGGPYDPSGGRPVGPYGDQTGGEPVGPYGTHGPLPSNQNDRINHRGLAPRNVKATQAFLRAQGYNIAVDGRWGPQTAAAVADWHKPPKQRSISQRGPAGPAGPLGQDGRPLYQRSKSKPNLLDRVKGQAVKATEGTLKSAAKARVKAGKGKGGAGGGGGATPSYGLGGLGMSPDTGSFLSEGLSKSGASMLDPNGFADSLAGLEYDPAIRDLKVQIARHPADATQQLADIGSWYGQVGTDQAAAAKKNAAAGDAATAAQEAATQSILASLGGGASGGAGMVASQGLQDVGTLRQEGLAQSQYDTQMGPILAAAAAAAKKTTQVRNANQAQDLENQLVDVTGKRGQAKAGHLFDITKYDNDIRDRSLDRLLQIKQYNNNLSQQRYGNRMSAQEAAVAAAMTGAQINSLNAGTKSAGGGGGWGGLDAGQKATLIENAIAPYVDKDGSLIANPDEVGNSAREYLRGLGYTSARKSGMRVPSKKAQNQILGMLGARIKAAQAAARHAQTLNQ